MNMVSPCIQFSLGMLEMNTVTDNFNKVSAPQINIFLLKTVWLRFISLTGKAEGFLFEDDGDGYEFTQGNYLLTHYVAELQSSVVTVSVHKTEGSWERPKRHLHIQLLLGGGAMVCKSKLWRRWNLYIERNCQKFCLIYSLIYLLLGTWS